MKNAFTLVELLVTIAVIGVLTGIAVPAYERTVQSGRAAACVSNMRQLGAALNLYLADHNMILPTLKAGRSSITEDVPVIDNTLNAYTGNMRVFQCPGDNANLYATTGTSYYWDVAVNGQPISNLQFLTIATDPTHIPLLADKEAFHPYTQNKVNILYADGHATRDLSFVQGDN
jgi:prepilin-type N-terminal cleavage/methylation domain-containing protein/prepilin-type processing-associated H-X9-DG protein